MKPIWNKLVLVLLIFSLGISSTFALDDCIKKVSSEFGKPYAACGASSENSYTVVLKNVCNKNIDIVYAIQETSTHWVRFERSNIAPNDTVVGNVCEGSGKYQCWFRENGDKSALPSYDEINAEYFKKMGIKPKAPLKIMNELHMKLFVGDKAKEPLVNQKVFYISSDGEKKSAVTDKTGDFLLNKLDQNEKVEIELEKTPNLEKIQKVYIAKANGAVVNEMVKNKNGEFKFTMLPAMISEMTKLDESDNPYLKIRDFENSSNKEITLQDNILYASGSAEINNDAAKQLDKLVEILKDNKNLKVQVISHTDSRGDDAANLKLSERRAENSVKYIISKGIDATRVSAKGMGETKISNRCVNGVICSEEEHSINRRTELKFEKK